MKIVGRVSISSMLAIPIDGLFLIWCCVSRRWIFFSGESIFSMPAADTSTVAPRHADRFGEVATPKRLARSLTACIV